MSKFDTDTNNKSKLNSITKRNFVIGGTALVATSQTKWAKPAIDSILLPAHAQTSLPDAGDDAPSAPTPIDDAPSAPTPIDDAPSAPTPTFGMTLQSTGQGSCVETYIPPTSTTSRGHTQDYLESFTLTNDSTVPVTIANILPGMVANGTIMITRTDGALGLEIPAGGTASFDATLALVYNFADDASPGGVQIGSGVPNTVCNDALPTYDGNTLPLVPFPIQVPLTVTVNEDDAPIDVNLEFDAA